MSFTVNEVLKSDITKIDNLYLPPDFHDNANIIRHMQCLLRNEIDRIGIKSTQAQGLSKILTSSEKLAESNNILYLLKDREANQGKGLVIGLLRVGVKSLYLCDSLSTTRHVHPLSVLDFYVDENYQKLGNGKKLFDYMLKDCGKTIHELAIDNPSDKMELFLRKHFHIVSLLKQSNKFAISPKFFDTFKTEASPAPSLAAAACMSIAPVRTDVGRFAARPPPSLLSSIIHGEHTGTLSMPATMSERAVTSTRKT